MRNRRRDDDDYGGNSNTIIIAIFILVILVVGYYLYSKRQIASITPIAGPARSTTGGSTTGGSTTGGSGSAPVRTGGSSTAPAPAPAPSAPMMTPASNTSPNAPKYCHKCDINCTPGNCIYGCSRGIDYKSAPGDKIEGTPIMISDYRFNKTDNEKPDYVIDGNQYWFRQNYDDNACTAKYTGTYNAVATTNPFGNGKTIATEVCEPGCWPGECKYKPIGTPINENPMASMKNTCEGPYRANMPPDGPCTKYDEFKRMAGPGWNVEPLLNKNNAGWGVGGYQSNVHFTDYPYYSPGTKMPFTYGQYWSNLEDSCNSKPLYT